MSSDSPQSPDESARGLLDAMDLLADQLLTDASTPQHHGMDVDLDDTYIEDLVEERRPYSDAYTNTAAYRHWLRERARLGLDDPPRPKAHVRIAVVVDARGTDVVRLQRCIGSIHEQSVPTRTTLVVRKGQTLSDACGSLGEYDWLTLMSASDVLDAAALARVSLAAQSDAAAELIYTDEDHIDTDGERSRPIFKPDWSPELLESCPYLGNLLVLKKSLVDKLGGLPDKGRYDLMLRASESAKAVLHVPSVLCHRGGPERSFYSYSYSNGAPDGASNGAEETESDVAALETALARRDEDGRVEAGPIAGTYYVRRKIGRSSLVSIIIPFRDQPAMLRTCVDSIVAEAGQTPFEVVLVDNDSIEPETHALLDRLKERPGIKVIRYPGNFNWSAINNAAVRSCDGEALVFLNNDIEARRPAWLDAMAEQAFRKEVGVVGARLVYPDGTVQHVGTVLGLGVIAAHLMPGLPAGEPGYMGFAKLVRNVSAVTGACMMSRRDVFESVGGFDEDMHVAFNDVDFCLRLGERGQRVVFTPLAELVHHESVSRGFTGFYRDYSLFLERWQDQLRAGDPFFNPNLSRLSSTEIVVRPADEDMEWETNLSRLMS